MKDIRQNFLNEIQKYRNVIIYGAGHVGMMTLQFCIENLDITHEIYVAVTKKKDTDYDLCGYPICEITDYYNMCNNSIVLVATSETYFNEIDEILSKHSFTHIKHIDNDFFEYCLYAPFMHLPIQYNKILVENFHGLGYGDSPKYIVEELLKRNLDLDIVWVVKKNSDYCFPKGIRTVVIYSTAFFREVYTSRIWISNVRKYQCVRKRKGQFYMQTWHGVALKKIENDADIQGRKKSTLYYDAGRKDSLMIDVLLSNCRYMTEIFKKCFYSPQTIVETGFPRNDVFFKNNIQHRQKIRNYFGIPVNRKIVLYAPTFRNDYVTVNPYNLDLELLIEALNQRFGEEFVCLMRLHPNIAAKADGFKYNERIKNATYYEDIMELLNGVDVLVTDYSSSMFDFMYTKKPIFLFAPDMQRYIAEDRGFYLDYESLPFTIAQSNEQMKRNIITFDEGIYQIKLKSFIEKLVCVDDGSASERSANIIIEKLLE